MARIIGVPEEEIENIVRQSKGPFINAPGSDFDPTQEAVDKLKQRTNEEIQKRIADGAGGGIPPKPPTAVGFPEDNGDPEITFGHGGRHLEGSGLSQESVESAIRGAIGSVPTAGNHWGWVQINGQWIQYRMYTLPNGTRHIGTYFPVSGNLRNH